MNRPAFLALFILCAAALASGLGRDEKKDDPKQTPENKSLKLNGGRADGANEDAPQDRPVRVSGRVRLVGTGVFPELVISGEEREWYIGKDEQSLLMEFQQRVVTVEGTESYADLTFANGMPAGRRYTLKNIRLVSADQSQ